MDGLRKTAILTPDQRLRVFVSSTLAELVGGDLEGWAPGVLAIAPKRFFRRERDHAPKEAIMATADDIDAAILEHLATQRSCTVGELTSVLSDLTLNQVLFAVDRLSRNGKLVLRRPLRFEYLVSPVCLGVRPGETDKDMKSVR